MQRDVPRGTISVWSGSIADIPSTYRLCDGTHGTPDLSDKFIVGAGDTYNPGDKSSVKLHSHVGTTFNFPHVLTPGTDIAEAAGFRNESNPVSGSITTSDIDANVKYYSLAYVMYDGRPS